MSKNKLRVPKNKSKAPTALVGKQIKEHRVAKEIELILVREGMALQPFLAYTEFGIAPRVRLIEVNESSNGETNSETEVEGAGTTDEPTESVQS